MARFQWPSIDGKGVSFDSKKAFAAMWVAGTLGAYFGFISVNAPYDLAPAAWSRSASSGVPYLLELAIRYLYLLWFVAYFFISNFRHESDTMVDRREVAFNIVQSTVAFIAAYYLGFLIRNDAMFAQPILSGIIAANAAILIICLLSLVLFGFEDETGRSNDEKNGDAKLNALRATALAASAAGLILSVRIDKLTLVPAIAILALQVVLWIAWNQFRRIRVRYA